ncbi:MAG: SDR family NAD(P)-dependent oxidoreductase [Acidobacteria bacterium]|nr:SDR family NAD(P)-dependent oxidoreductase [Acidobacteriota bacterium]
MTDSMTRTALVTGASSGLGFETSAQLAEQGYGRVIITARTAEKADAARQQLVERTNTDPFETLVLDNDRLATVESAATELVERGGGIDVLVLNAGIAPPSNVIMTSDGLEGTVAATLVGHHLLTMRILENGLLNQDGRIVISGSEAARGDVPTFHPLDVKIFADEHFNGDLEAAIESYVRMAPPAEYKSANTYATAKQFVAWWAAELARQLPEGTTVNAVSPGSTPETNADRNAAFYMKYLMVPVLKLIPGMSHSVADGAGRYLEAVEFGPEVSGKFFASPPKKMTGPLTEIQMDHLDNPDAQRALWNVMSKVAGGVGMRATS